MSGERGGGEEKGARVRMRMTILRALEKHVRAAHLNGLWVAVGPPAILADWGGKGTFVNKQGTASWQQPQMGRTRQKAR